MKRGVFHAVCWSFIAILALALRVAAAVPSDIMVSEKSDSCCPIRVELTGGNDAYLLSGRDLLPGSATEQGGILLLEFKAKNGDLTTHSLTANGDAWVDETGNRWLPKKSLLKATDGWTSVKISATDQSGKAIIDFNYRYTINWKDGDWDPLLVRPLKGSNGEVVLSAPNECQIFLSIDHPDFVRGFGSAQTLERKDGKDVLLAQFRMGHKVTGKVVDAVSGKTVAGAVVSPLIFTPPSFSPDLDHSSVTPEKGSFELHGVDSSFAVEHPDYVKTEIDLDEKKPEKPQVVKLAAGQAIRGMVVDADHKPLAGVHVDDGSGKTMTTGEDGRFLLQGLSKWREDVWSLDFEKDGFQSYSFEAKRIGKEDLTIQMAELPKLRGQVFHADGTPVVNYHLICAPGENPADYQSLKETIEDPAGHFDVQARYVPEKGNNYWLGVWTEGSAPWDGVVPLDQLQSGGFRIVLEKGVALSATIDASASSAQQFDVLLEPVDRNPEEEIVVSTHPGKALASKLVSVKRDEPLRIPNLRNGNYRLSIEGKGATPQTVPVTLGKADVDLGVIKLLGTGSISGVVQHPDEAHSLWRFADGGIFIKGFGGDRQEPYQKFKTDAQGRFQVANVPVGEISVLFSYMETADIMGDVSGTARIVAGKNTEMHFEGVGGSWTQPIQLLFEGKDTAPVYKGIRKVENITDRDALFRFEMTALDPDPFSGPQTIEWEMNKKSSPAIPDLSPGHWKIQVFDWLGSRGFTEGWRGEAVVQIGEVRKPFTIELGARTLSGKVTAPKETERNILIVAVRKSNKHAYFSRCDDAGNFVVRYLPQDEYFIHAHDDDGGWCDFGTRILDKPLVDCGEIKLADGGKITGKLDHSLLPLQGEAVVKAHAPDGAEIPVDEIEKDGTYQFGNLRPGAWTIYAPSKTGESVAHPVEVQKGKTVAIPLEN